MADLSNRTAAHLLTENDLDVAVAAGTITQAQRDALLGLRGAPGAPTGGGRRVPVVLEILGYLGAILTIIGGGILVSQVWADMADAARLGLFAVLSSGLWAVGAALDEDADEIFWRLRGFLWLLSTAALAGFTAMLAADVFDWRRQAVGIATGAAAALQSAALWKLKDRPAQHVSFFVGAVAALGSAGNWVDGPGFVGIVFWVFAAGWLVLGLRDVVRPPNVALVLGPVLMLIGAAMTGGTWESAAALFGLATACALLAIGSLARRFVVTGVGVVGVFNFLPMAAAEYFGETVGVPVVLLSVGVLLLVAMVVVLRRHSGGHPAAS